MGPKKTEKGPKQVRFRPFSVHPRPGRVDGLGINLFWPVFWTCCASHPGNEFPGSPLPVAPGAMQTCTLSHFPPERNKRPPKKAPGYRVITAVKVGVQPPGQGRNRAGKARKKSTTGPLSPTFGSHSTHGARGLHPPVVVFENAGGIWVHNNAISGRGRKRAEKGPKKTTIGPESAHFRPHSVHPVWRG